jgi:glycosyltransferase involved in cell wall biosynthesis
MSPDVTKADIVMAAEPLVPRRTGHLVGESTGVTDAAPQVAVVIPVYRQGHYLADSVLSVVRQTMAPIAIVIVDDGCPSISTPRVARRLVSMFPNVTYLRTTNRGVAHARNYGVRFALEAFPSVQAVFFLDADDRLSPHTLATMWEPLALAPPSIGWSYSNYDFFGLRSGAWTISRPFNQFRQLFDNQSGAESLVHRRVFEAGIFHEESEELTWEDYEFFLHASTRGFLGIHAGDTGIRYRVRGYSRLAEIIHERDLIHGKVAARHPATFEARSRTRLEHATMPRFLLVGVDDRDGSFFTDPLAPSRKRLSVSEIRSTIAQYVDEYPNTAIYVPPIVLIAAPGVDDCLSRSAFAPGALFQIQQAVRDHTVVAVSAPSDGGAMATLHAAHTLAPGDRILLLAITLPDLVALAAGNGDRDQTGSEVDGLPVASMAFAEHGHPPVQPGAELGRMFDLAAALAPGNGLTARIALENKTHSEFALDTAHSHNTTFPWSPSAKSRPGTDIVFLVDRPEASDGIAAVVPRLAAAITAHETNVRAHLLITESRELALSDADVAPFTTVSMVSAIPSNHRNEALLLIAQSADWVVDTGTVMGRTVLWYLKRQNGPRYAVLLSSSDSADATLTAATVASTDTPPQDVRGGLSYVFSRYYEPLVDRIFVSSEHVRRKCINRGAPPDKVIVLADALELDANADVEPAATKADDWALAASTLLATLAAGT